MPILISEIKPGYLAETSGKFIVGDAVLSVNGIDLQKAKHNEAVDILSRLVGERNHYIQMLFVWSIIQFSKVNLYNSQA